MTVVLFVLGTVTTSTQKQAVTTSTSFQNRTLKKIILKLKQIQVFSRKGVHPGSGGCPGVVQKSPWRVWGGVWEMIEICKIVKIPEKYV